VEQPGQIVGAAVIDAIRKDAPAVQAAVLLIGAAEEVAAPAPFLGPGHERRRIDRFDLAGVVDPLVSDLVLGPAGRMHVAFRAVRPSRSSEGSATPGRWSIARSR